ncbi:hypothetical protein G7Y89_g13550 [Cudoniella acicularis]|uniref:Uncharacterized protein n=1 Tax=Cudoniella acicularis TaxID=354080 RepID=A0A8H4R717_9HELO|nr:hypothetical protein G7Y89_g13550 [Cudoniella acicularis]
MQNWKDIVLGISLFMKFSAATDTCLPLTTDTALCSIPPGIISSDGQDDVCVLVACCNGEDTPEVEIPSGSFIDCLSVNCTSVCSLSQVRNGLSNEACDNTCTPPIPAVSSTALGTTTVSFSTTSSPGVSSSSLSATTSIAPSVTPNSPQGDLTCTFVCWAGSLQSPGPQISCGVGTPPFVGAGPCTCYGEPGVLICAVCSANTEGTFQEVCGGSAPNTISTTSTVSTASTSTTCPPLPTPTNNNPFNWAPLVEQACSNYKSVQTAAPATLGYFGQIVNIVCAASKSMDPCCATYPTHFIHSDNLHQQYFLNPANSPVNIAAETAISNDAVLIQLLEPWWLQYFFGSRDIGALLAGAQHFITNLAPAFTKYVDGLIEHFACTCNKTGLDSATASLEMEHQALFNCAVIPGFGVEGQRGELDPLPVTIAQLGVPLVAASLRNYFLSEAYLNLYLPSCGTKPVSPIPRRSFNDNITLPSIDEVTDIANSINLTAPSDAPLAFDPRAWVPKKESSLSLANLPSAHFQILPNTTRAVVETGVHNSSVSISISANRSSLPSQATIAICLNSIGWNFTETSILQTAYPLLPNHQLSIFGLIAMVIPATAPIGTNAYLFDGPSVDVAYSQYLNQSSVFNDNYNVLFTSFNLSLTYDVIPHGVNSSQLVLVDLITGQMANSSKVDESNCSVNADGVTGHSGVWGGGGIYAIGF